MFFKDLNRGVDILNQERKDYLGIKLGTDELDLYNDNCKPYLDENGLEVVKYVANVEGKLHPTTKTVKNDSKGSKS